MIFGKALTRYLKAKEKIRKDLVREIRKINADYNRNRAEIFARGAGI